ncbi:hypothetical protein [Clostridium sp. JN-9]|uniref:hypothetical protein n=1 Tax=Clostridium sp. JN-9 TaxID=2507159 RepID=UPI000FFE180F|nr:hypothetical protein [Clostridium sp. JN-9]QAT39684.1 hypothetical protein EQM05_05140 [Clostridium sp. JN-9]
METHEGYTTAIGIALLYTIFTSLFSLLNRLTLFIIPQGGFISTLNLFFQKNALWIIVVAAIIILLNSYLKKMNIDFNDYIIKNNKICLISGTLIAIEGLINLSSLLPAYISSSKLSIQTSQLVTGNMTNSPAKYIVISNIISIFIILLQIITGIYLARFHKGKVRND